MPHPKTFSNARILFAILIALAMPLSGTYAFAQTETVLYNFQGGLGDGANPNGGLIADAAGNFYGTTAAGGTNGTVFEFIRGGARNEVPIHFFNGEYGQGAWVLKVDCQGKLDIKGQKWKVSKSLAGEKRRRVGDCAA